LFFALPRGWHKYKPHPISGWEEYWVGFYGEYPDELMRKETFKPESLFIKNLTTKI
jgi:hypothetical protein